MDDRNIGRLDERISEDFRRLGWRVAGSPSANGTPIEPPAPEVDDDEGDRHDPFDRVGRLVEVVELMRTELAMLRRETAAARAEAQAASARPAIPDAVVGALQKLHGSVAALDIQVAALTARIREQGVAVGTTNERILAADRTLAELKDQVDEIVRALVGAGPAPRPPMRS